MTPLIDLWPSLTPRERDARVAEALGWTIRKYAFLKNDQRQGWHDPEDRARNLPYFTTQWADAGPLLDRMRKEEWSLSIDAYTDNHGNGLWEVLAVRGQSRIVARGLTGPESMALAFCLSREGAA